MINTTEQEEQYIVTQLGPLNFGNPEATISYEKRDNQEILEQINAKTVEIIKNGWAMTDITEPDDGCFDGREAEGLAVQSQDGVVVTKEIDKPNHERPLVAGGGYANAVVIRIATGNRGENIEDDYRTVPFVLKENGVVCGAHRAKAHAEGICGCGNIDKQKQILKDASVNYFAPIKEVTQTLTEAMGYKFDNDRYDSSMQAWDEAVEDPKYFAGSTGDSRSKVIMEIQDEINNLSGDGKLLTVTKNLIGEHNEKYITINLREGKKFSQSRLRNLLSREFPGVDSTHFPQVFSLDAPRLVEITEALEEPENTLTGLQASLAYQIATAAELTDGSLPVFVIK